MKLKYILILLLAVLPLAGCNDGTEKWDPNKNNGGGNTTPVKPTPAVTADSWAGLSDSLAVVLIDNFMNRKEGTFWSTPFDRANNSHYLYWQQAHAMDVLVYAYERIKYSDPERAALYADYMRLWYENDAHNYNNTHESDGIEGHFYNDWIDDMAWICLTMLHMSEALGDDTYADTARKIYDRYIINQQQPNGGLPWTYQDDKRFQNACTNAPACLIAALLYKKYHVSSYKGDALNLYNFIESNLLSSDFRVEEPPLTYTQGTFGEACRQLYIITADSKYMTMAGNVLYYAFTSNRCTQNGLLRHEGTSDDQALFKGILIPYTVNYILDPTCTYHSADLSALLKKNAQALYSHLSRANYPQMYANYYWGEDFDYTQTPSMCAHASGTHLIEGMARLVANE